MQSMIIAVSNAVQAAAARELVKDAELDALVLQTAPEEAVDQVRAQMDGSVVVVVAQGQLAQALKGQPDLALVEAVLLGQDLAVLLRQACRQLGHAAPRVALIGQRYMFSDPEPIAALLGAEVFLYYISSNADLPLALERAYASGAELVICDDALCPAVEAAGLKTLAIGPAWESLRSAIRAAARLALVLQQEQRRSQEIQSLVQYSYDVILRLNSKGEIVFANPRAEKALGQTSEKLQGQKLLELSGLVAPTALTHALQTHQDAYSTVLQMGQVSYVANIAAVTFEGQNDGWIISMQEFAAIDDLDERIRQERRRRGYIAHAKFADFPSRSPKMKALLAEAETYAQYDVPILISGEPRLAKSRLAECIHNASLRRRNPFVMVDIGTMPPENQFDLLFGRRSGGDIGLVSQANKGTLFLLDVNALAPDCQRQLLSVLRSGTFRRKDTLEPIPVSVRLICSTFFDLMELARQGQWMFQLANTLLGLNLHMPPIRETPEDIPALLEEYMEASCKRFKKQVTLSEDAVMHLCRYPWPSNLRDIEYFCLKAVMLAVEPEISLAFVHEKLLPDLEEGTREQAAYIVADREELEIRRALREAAGNRGLAAERLGMGRSTLWRKMKKYGIE